MLDNMDLKNLRRAREITLPVSVMSPEQKRSYKVLQTCGWVEPLNYCGTGRTCFKTTPSGEEALAKAEANEPIVKLRPARNH